MVRAQSRAVDAGGPSPRCGLITHLCPCPFRRRSRILDTLDKVEGRVLEFSPALLSPLAPTLEWLADEARGEA